MAATRVNLPQEVLNQISTVVDLFKLAGIKGAVDDPQTVAGSLAQLLGAEASTPALTVAILAEPVFEEALDAWEITSGGAKRKPTVIERGQALVVGRAARLAAGVRDPGEEVTASPLPASSTTENDKKKRVKLTAILSQHDETEIVEDISRACAYQDAYEAIYGVDERPRPQEAPSLI